MITSKDLKKKIDWFRELAEIDKRDDPVVELLKQLLYATTLELELLRDIRYNQVLELSETFGDEILNKGSENNG